MWRNKKVLVTGGASFIGSHLVNSLLQKGANVKIADDLSSGKLCNLGCPLEKERSDMWVSDNLTIFQGDLKEKSFTARMVKDAEVVFHLANLHGGRGYIQTHPTECCTNMILDQLVFEEAHKAMVERICFASSACVYPVYLMDEKGPSYLLKEEDADPFARDKAFADLEYGWVKLMGEMALKAYHRQHGMKTSSVRIHNAYGPHLNETHAIIALIAKAFVRMDPYEIWGTGEQNRNFTYVQDIVDAMILTAERIEDGSAINAGRDDRITIDQAAELIFDIAGWHPRHIVHDLSKPVGVSSRAADLTKARKLLNWEPKVSYRDGIKKTVKWYFANNEKVKERFAANTESLLLERH